MTDLDICMGTAEKRCKEECREDEHWFVSVALFLCCAKIESDL